MVNTAVDAAEVKKALANFKKAMPEKQKECMEKVCLKVEADAKKNVPKSVTGNLRASITHEVAQKDNNTIGYVGSNLDYAPYIHQGTGIYALEGNGRKQVPWVYFDLRNNQFVSTEGIQPTPFIQMAIDQNREDILAYFEGVVSE